MRIASLVFALMALTVAPAHAQTDYPTRPIRILVPYAPGGISDIAARLVGAKLTDAFGQQVIVENRPGGNGFIAVADAAKSTPDGYTLVMVTILLRSPPSATRPWCSQQMPTVPTNRSAL
jgi:tripartite-type tricarboxylate transporter receptor subunit TctC